MGSKRRASVAEPSDGSDVEISHKAAKKIKSGAGMISPAKNDDDGNPFWELSKTRRVGVSQYKGKNLISVREYYEKDGKLLPGKKGISLSLEQYSVLLKTLPAINSKLREMGHPVDASDYVEGDIPAISKKSKKEKSDKANIEATSEEEVD